MRTWKCCQHCRVSTHQQHRFSGARTNPNCDEHAYPCIRCGPGEPGQQVVS